MKKKPSTNARPLPKLRKTSHRQILEFPGTKGRVVEKIELSADLDYPCVSVYFQDKTDLTVVIDPALIFEATFSDWKTGNQRVLKRWPAVRSEP